MDRVVFLTGEISVKSVASVSERLFELSSKSSEPIYLIINSEGGDTCAAIALYDVIDTCGAPVIGVIYGRCYSSAVVTLQACTVRIMSLRATLMVHEGSLDEVEAKSIKEAKVELAALEEDEKAYWGLIAKRSGLSVDVIRDFEKDVTYFGASEALTQNLVDGVLDGSIWDLPSVLGYTNKVTNT